MPLQASFTVLCFFISRLYGSIEIQNGRKKVSLAIIIINFNMPDIWETTARPLL